MRTILLRCFMLMFLSAIVPELSAFEVTKETRILIGEKPSPSTVLAAEELSLYLGKICAIAPPVLRRDSGGSSRIVIGTLAQMTGSLPEGVKAKLADAGSSDAFALVSKGNTLYIAGKASPGELYGVYAFLQNKLSVRFFRAATKNDPFEYVPKVSPLRWKDFELVRSPVFRYRLLTHAGGTGKIPVNGQTLAVRQGFQINPPWDFKRAFREKFYQARTSVCAIRTGAHLAFSNAIPLALFDTHPEYFALQNGERIRGRQICISNPDVQKLVIRHVEELFRKYSPLKIHYLFGMADQTSGWCECASCRALDGENTSDPLNVSNRFHKVVVKIMASLYKKYPQAMLESWAYHTYRSIPQNVQYDARAILCYCPHGRCYGHALSDPDCRRNAFHLDLMKQWQKISHRMRTYEYSNCSDVLYGCMEEVLAKDLRTYKAMGIEGWKDEMRFADAQLRKLRKKVQFDPRKDLADSNWQWYCVAGRLLWDPDQDVEKILEDVESKYYSKAYSAMKKYHAFRRKLWNHSAICLGYPSGNPRTEQLLLVPGAKKKLLQYLAEAERLAGKDTILLNRLKEDRLWLMRYWITPAGKARIQKKKEYSVPLRTGKIRMDGDPSDGAWLGAFHTEDFFESASGRKNSCVLSLLADREDLYLRFLASGTWKEGERVDFFLMKPSASGEYFKVSVLIPSGRVSAVRYPDRYGNALPGTVAAVGRQGKERYVLELKIPLHRIGKLQSGSLWKIHAVRHDTGTGRTAGLDGVSDHDTASYRGFVLGSPLLKNGTFEELNQKGSPSNWSIRRGEVLKKGFSHAVRLSRSGSMYQLLTRGELKQKNFPRRIRITFRASGKGELFVSAQRYSDKRDPKAKHGYKRKHLGTQRFYKAALTSREQIYSCEYTIASDEWIGLRFSTGSRKDSFAVLDDVSVMLSK